MHDDDLTGPGPNRVDDGIRLPHRAPLSARAHRTFTGALAGLSLGLGLAQRPEKPENAGASASEAQSDPLPVLPPVQAATPPNRPLQSALATHEVRYSARRFASFGLSKEEAGMMAAAYNLLGGPMREVEMGFHEPVRNADTTSWEGVYWADRAGGRKHKGIDLTGDDRLGLAVAPGFVAHVDFTRSAGWYVIMLHPRADGAPIRSKYMHCEENSAKRLQAELRENGWKAVSAGEPIGCLAGRSGNVMRANNPRQRQDQIHYEFGYTRFWNVVSPPPAVDPTPYLFGEKTHRIIDMGNANIRDAELVEAFQESYNTWQRSRGGREIDVDGKFRASTAKALTEAYPHIARWQARIDHSSVRYANQPSGRGSSGVTR